MTSEQEEVPVECLVKIKVFHRAWLLRTISTHHIHFTALYKVILHISYERVLLCNTDLYLNVG